MYVSITLNHNSYRYRSNVLMYYKEFFLDLGIQWNDTQKNDILYIKNLV